MRVLILFAQFLGILLATGAAAFLLTRETLLAYGSFTLHQSVRTLRSLAQRPGIYPQQCLQKFDGVNGEMAGFQLRFVDDRSYRLEAVCRFRESDPLPISAGMLPPFVRKIPGSAGVVIPVNGSYDAEIILELWGRHYNVSIQGGGGSLEGEVSSPAHPVTVCAGWGYHCCDVITEVPVGQVARVPTTDCPTSCYAQCSSRPVILAFRSDPQADPLTQIVNISGSSVVVNFSFSITGPNSPIQQIQIQYGDGTTETFSGDQETVTHEYTCATSSCSYTAKVIATDILGVTSPDTRVAMIVIKLQQ